MPLGYSPKNIRTTIYPQGIKGSNCTLWHSSYPAVIAMSQDIRQKDCYQLSTLGACSLLSCLSNLH